MSRKEYLSSVSDDHDEEIVVINASVESNCCPYHAIVVHSEVLCSNSKQQVSKFCIGPLISIRSNDTYNLCTSDSFRNVDAIRFGSNGVVIVDIDYFSDKHSTRCCIHICISDSGRNDQGVLRNHLSIDFTVEEDCTLFINSKSISNISSCDIVDDLSRSRDGAIQTLDL